jgi:GT2 family glycosyltransferase
MSKVSSITAIGPLKTYGKFIKRFIDNVVEQEMFIETEHIIIYSELNNEIEKFNQYKNFKLIQEPNSLGVYNAWNIGIENSTTDYITNWNVDDIRHPLNIKLKYELLSGSSFYSVAYNYYVATEDINENFYNINEKGKNYLKFPDEYEKYCMTACLCGPDPMWRKSIHSKIGNFDYENFNSIGDWEMWIRMAANGYKFKLIPQILCIYLNHDETISNNNFKNNYDQIQKIKLYEKYKNFHTQQCFIERICL